MTVVTGQSGPDDTPDLIANLLAEVNDLRGRLSESEGTNHDLAQLVMSLRVERDRLTNQHDRIVSLTEQRDRARDVAVALEQEIAILEDWRAKHPNQPTGPGELDQIFAKAFTADRHAGFMQAISETEQRIPPFSEELAEAGQQETNCDCWHDGRWHVAGSACCQRSQGAVAADDPGALADPDVDPDTLTVTLDNATARFTPDVPGRDFLQEIAEKMTNHDYELDQELGTDG